MLFSEADKVEGPTEDDEQSKPLDESPGSRKLYVEETTPIRSLRRFQSQPHLSSDTKRRRHFSFEPGEDHLQALKEELTPTATVTTGGRSSTSGSPDSTVLLIKGVQSSPEGLVSPYQVPSPDPHSLSKIPTPVQPFGSLRRETSVTSLQSTRAASSDGRHTSQSSILTAFRENQSGSLRPNSSSRSSSFNNLRGTDASPSSIDRPGSVRVRSSVANLATTRVGDQANRTAASKGGSPARSTPKTSTTALSSRAGRHTGPLEAENNDPTKSAGP